VFDNEAGAAHPMDLAAPSRCRSDRPRRYKHASLWCLFYDCSQSISSRSCRWPPS